jgi:hypothetical protein
MRRAKPLSGPRLVVALTATLTLTAAVALPGAAPQASAQTPTSTWNQLSPAISPPGTSGPSMAYDPATHQLVLFGGSTASGLLNDTWTWNGTTWTQLSPATSPPARDFASMAYDSSTSQLVLFGGYGISGDKNESLNDTWSWNGATWTRLSPATSPPVRTSAAMADDPATGQLILFGGDVAGGGGLAIYNDTWNWNGTDWIRLSPTEVPPASEGASMAYDTAASQFILYGGEGDGVGYDATFYWNGANWTPTDFVNGVFQGGAGDTFASPLTYDPGTGQFLLFEGGNGQGPDGPGNAPPPPAVLNETWTWNGSIWTQLAPASSPSPREAATMAYDSATNQLILFGGETEGAQTLYNDTWVWGAATAITSAASYDDTGGPFTFTVTTSGIPTPAISLASGSSLPTGVSMTDNENGTATLAGTSAAAPGIYTFTIQAANGINPAATQSFTLTVGDLPVTSILIPSGGTTLSGTTYLDAAASNATNVEFLLFGGVYGYSAPVVCTATATLYGWLCAWNTTTVPNGTYALVSKAFNSVGNAFSSGVRITVNNPLTTSSG